MTNSKRSPVLRVANFQKPKAFYETADRADSHSTRASRIPRWAFPFFISPTLYHISAKCQYFLLKIYQVCTRLRIIFFRFFLLFSKNSFFPIFTTVFPEIQKNSLFGPAKKPSFSGSAASHHAKKRAGYSEIFRDLYDDSKNPEKSKTRRPKPTDL